MAKAIKTKKVNEAEFLAALENHCKAHNREASINAKMEDRLEKIRAEYAPELTALGKTKEETLETAQKYCEANEAVLFAEKRSTVTTFGTVGFKKGNPATVLCEGKTWDEVLATLQKKLPSYVKDVPTIDKAKIIADREVPNLAARLEGIGVKIEQKESFFFKPKTEKAA